MTRTPTYKITVTIGALARRHVRRELRKFPVNVVFTEDKGLLDSQFVITGVTQKQYTVLMKWFQDMAEADDN
jgi:hypothetical protein